MKVMQEKYLNIIETLIEVHMAFISISDKEVIELANTFLNLLQERKNTEGKEKIDSISIEDLIAIQEILKRSRNNFKGRMIV